MRGSKPGQVDIRVAHQVSRASRPLEPPFEGLFQQRHGSASLLGFALDVDFRCDDRACAALSSHQIFGVNKHIAGVDERLGRFLLANAHHKNSGLADACGESRVIAIGGDQTKRVHHAGMQNIHRIDNHGAVGGVLADGVTELLDGLEGVEVQRLFPRIHFGRRPIAVDASDGDLSITRRLRQHLRKQGRLGVVAVNQHRDFLSRQI